MRKLRLDMDALVVETFETAAVRYGTGTVHGARVAVLGYGSGDSDCGNCHSDDPCTGIPIDTCTCGCGDVLMPAQPAGVAEASGCAATSPCTCIPIETCSCSPGYY
ncbi:MAG TPA: hypothetical protein VFE05_18715 [Longimicrobiaceae bacterium]|nr:hypothetical protein [Longimicrobiaceae bacterium]